MPGCVGRSESAGSCLRTEHRTALQGVESRVSLLQQPGPKKFKLSKIELINKFKIYIYIYTKAKKFKVPPKG